MNQILTDIPAKWWYFDGLEPDQTDLFNECWMQGRQWTTEINKNCYYRIFNVI